MKRSIPLLLLLFVGALLVLQPDLSPALHSAAAPATAADRLGDTDLCSTAFSTIEQHERIGLCKNEVFIGCRPSFGECHNSCPTGRAARYIPNDPNCASDPYDSNGCYCCADFAVAGPVEAVSPQE